MSASELENDPTRLGHFATKKSLLWPMQLEKVERELSLRWKAGRDYEENTAETNGPTASFWLGSMICYN